MGTADDVQHFLRTGEHDAHCRAWPGDPIEREQRAHVELRQALVEEVQRRTKTRASEERLRGLDIVALTRRKVKPMVRGLFSGLEQGAILSLLETSVVILTPANIIQVLLKSSWLNTAWDLANLYLLSVGAELQGEDAPLLLGISEHTTCCVSLAYFEEVSPFADFLVHEAAHVFHNCKRRTVWLLETRRREWLLDIDFRKRETLAYACEAYSRLVAADLSPQARLALAEPFMRGRGNAPPHLLTAAPESDLRGRCLFSPDSPQVWASASVVRAGTAFALRATPTRRCARRGGSGRRSRSHLVPAGREKPRGG